MIGYYCLSPTGRDFFYLPHNLFVYTNSRTPEVNYKFEPEVLKRINSAIVDGRLNRKRLEDREWDIHEVEVPDRLLDRFRRVCFHNSNPQKWLKVALDIFNFVEDNYITLIEGDYDDLDDLDDREDPPCSEF